MSADPAELYRRVAERDVEKSPEEILAEIDEIAADIDVTREEIVEIEREAARESLPEEQ